MAYGDFVRRGLLVFCSSIEPCGQQVVARDGVNQRCGQQVVARDGANLQCELHTAGSTSTSAAVFPTVVFLFDTLSYVS